MSDVSNTFKEKLFECDKHVQKIQIAKQYLNEIMPFSVEGYAQISDIHASFVDQLIFRFSKLQDTIGESLFPAILILAQEYVKSKTFIDILNRIEELEIVTKDQWLELREVRNEISHEYSFNVDDVVVGINDIFNRSVDLIKIYKRIKDFCKINFSIVV